VTQVFVPDTEAAERMGMAARLAVMPDVAVRIGESFSTPAGELAAAIWSMKIRRLVLFME